MDSNKRLPIVMVPYRLPDPAWVAQRDEFGKLLNAEKYYLPEQLLEAEVLQLNVNKNTMRVRLAQKVYSMYKAKDEVVSFDTSISYFYAAFDIVGKGQQ
jgi:hypothetical protein